jgi:succinoglycan biosynthesis transport protein ExoP
MLDPERSKNFMTGEQGEAADEGLAFSVADFTAALRRQWLVFTVFLLLGVAGGGAFLILEKPNFSATTTILIDTRKYPESPQADIAARTTYDSSAAIDTQVEIMKSQTLARSVVDKRALWREPEFTASGGGLRSTVMRYLKLNSAAPNLTEEQLRGRAIGHFLKNLTVKRVADTFAIDISFESAYADQAANVANATAQAFIEWQRDLHREALTLAGEWLEERIKDLRQKSAVEQQSVAEYQAKHNVFDAGGSLADDKRLTELTNQIETARSQSTDAQAKLNQLNQVKVTGVSHSSDLEIISAIENAAADPSLATLRLRYLDLTNRYNHLLKLLPPTHQAVTDLRDQIQNAHSTLLDELARVRLMVKSRRDTAQEKVKDLQGQIVAVIKESRAAAAAQAALKQLEINAQTYQSLYDSFLHRYAEALQAERSPAAEAAVISPAEPPPIRNYKKALLMSAAIVAFGALIGALIAFVRERVSRPFWTARDVESKLRLPCTDVIPALDARDLKLAQATFLRGANSAQGEGWRQGLRNGDPVGYYALANPLSRFAESLRSVRIALKINRFEGERRAVGITSALPNEGKSSVALALAASAASAGVRTILVDCDFRNPAVTRAWFGKARHTGLVDIVRGDAVLSEVIQVDPDSGLHFVPTGSLHRHSHAGDMMANDSFAALIFDLKNQFDLVIIDLPPMSPITDVAISHNFVDGYLLVVEWGKTRAASVDFALRKMPQVHESVISVVLNKADINKIKKFGFYMNDYYSSKYADRYLVN